MASGMLIEVGLRMVRRHRQQNSFYIDKTLLRVLAIFTAIQIMRVDIRPLSSCHKIPHNLQRKHRFGILKKCRITWLSYRDTYKEMNSKTARGVNPCRHGERVGFNKNDAHRACGGRDSSISRDAKRCKKVPRHWKPPMSEVQGEALSFLRMLLGDFGCQAQQYKTFG